MAITIRKIAELAKTSRGTVDRVLNGREGVNPETAKRVLEVVETYGYEYNSVAIGLASFKNKFKIAVLVNKNENEFFQRFENGIKMFNERTEYRQLEFIYYHNHAYDESKQLDNLEKALKEHVDGFIITPVASPKVTDKLSRLTVPVVIAVHDIDIDNKLAFVGCDYYENGKFAANIVSALADDGLVTIVTGPKHVESFSRRIAGFKSELSDHFKTEVLYSDDSEIGNYKLISQYLKTHTPSLIYFAGYGVEGVIRGIKEAGKVIKVVSVDESDAVIRGLESGAISVTITQQPEKQGYRSALVLHEKLVFKKVPKSTKLFVDNKIKVKTSNFNEKSFDQRS